MPQRDSITTYIHQYWPKIIRQNREDISTLIGLPRPYLVPSDGAMFQEFYYWDSYFMALGLRGTEYEALILDIAENMAYLLKRFGFIPNASRYYFTSRSQPPFFSRLVWLAYEVKQQRGDADSEAYLRDMMALARKEYEVVWIGEKPPHHRLVHRGLSRYFDINYLDFLASCESGWDHSTRCEDTWLNFLPVDLNSILYVMETDQVRAADLLGSKGDALYWSEQAEKRRATFQELMWDADEHFFFDYNWKEQQRHLHPSLAGFYPLWAGLATPEQARLMVEKWIPRFLYPGGLVTTLDKKEGRQWAYPNGWAPLQWLVDAGLEKYGFSETAREIRKRWCRNCEKVFEQTGVMWEKYNVVDVNGAVESGLYGQVKGFGWSNAVYSDFIRRI
ncbi:MAG TPA: trehalase family glycosidase [Anaerolineaceae bacterium]|nr:trehalase family glycosidase [Anaerolineaceae bacterium]HPN50232.1 trehalase family glycosidase [Anaerolineaceae bacterium]